MFRLFGMGMKMMGTGTAHMGMVWGWGCKVILMSIFCEYLSEIAHVRCRTGVEPSEELVKA